MNPVPADVFRCFVAVEIPAEARAFLEAFMRESREAFPSYRFAAVQNLHITLQFLGDVERPRIPELLGALSVAVCGLFRFSVDFGEAGSFPLRGAPRVLHVAVGRGEAELSRLAQRVAAALSPLGFRQDKPFTAHITLGRARDRDSRARPDSDVASSWRAAFSRFREKAKGLTDWDIPQIILMESVLGPGGPIYTRRGTASLQE